MLFPIYWIRIQLKPIPDHFTNQDPVIVTLFFFSSKFLIIFHQFSSIFRIILHLLKKTK